MIPANITTELGSLQAQVAAATPLEQASAPTIKALQLNAEQLANDCEQAEYSLAGALDAFTAPTDPEDIIQAVLGAFGNAMDEANITQMRGLVGRAVSNLNQLGPVPRPLPPWQQPVGFTLPPWPKLMQPFAPTLTIYSDLPQVIVATIFAAPAPKAMTITTAAPTRTP